MAYKRKYKRAYRSTKRRKYTPKKRISKKFRMAVKKVLKRSIETKCNQYSSTSLPVYNYLSNTTITNLIPAIGQGTGQSNRVGNRVNPVKFTLKVALTCSDANGIYVGASPTYFDLYVFRWKEANETIGQPLAVDMQAFLEADNASIQYTGLVTDGLRRLNADKFQLLAKRRVCLSNFNSSTAGPGKYSQSNPNRTFSFDLTKHVKKTWLYQDAISAVSNDNLYLGIAATQTDGTNLATSVIGGYYFITEVMYKDA